VTHIKGGKTKKLKRVEVDWIDAHVWSGWRDEEEAKEVMPAQTHTIGYLLTQNRQYVKLTSGYSETNELYDSIHVIPKGWVTEIRELEGRCRGK